MSDERPPRPPPRARPPGDDDIVVVTEDAPATEKLRPKFVVPVGRAASIAEVSLQLNAVQQQLSSMALAQTKVLDTQRKMALQTDGLQSAMNQRFDVFHKELALLRSTVTGDHEPRLGKVEDVAKETGEEVQRVKASLGQRAAKGGGIVAVILLVAPMLADAIPKYKWLFDAITGHLK